MENAREKTAAVVLAAGKGKRMNSDIPKQYMMLRGKAGYLLCPESL